MGLANIRKKARLEGWTRSHIAEQLNASLPPDPQRRDQAADADPPAPVAPKQAVADATARASALLAQGRAGEAQVLIRSAEALAKLASVDPEAEAPKAELSGAALDNMAARYDDIILGKARSLAYAMLADPPHGATARHMWFLYHWRALHFGPKVVARDFAEAVDSGCADEYFTADGALRPIPEPESLSDLMIRQHLRACEWMDGAERLGRFRGEGLAPAGRCDCGPLSARSSRSALPLSEALGMTDGKVAKGWEADILSAPRN